MYIPCPTCQTSFDSLHMLIHPIPVYGHDELVLDVLPDQTKKHEGQGHVLRMQTCLGRDVLDGDLQVKEKL